MGLRRLYIGNDIPTLLMILRSTFILCLMDKAVKRYMYLFLIDFCNLVWFIQFCGVKNIRSSLKLKDLPEQNRLPICQSSLVSIRRAEANLRQEDLYERCPAFRFVQFSVFTV